MRKHQLARVTSNHNNPFTPTLFPQHTGSKGGGIPGSTDTVAPGLTFKQHGHDKIVNTLSALVSHGYCTDCRHPLTWAEDGVDEEDWQQVDAVLVDEASMLGLPLAAALLEALPTRCQLVFIGRPRSVAASHVPSLLPCSPQAQPRFPISRLLLAAALLNALPTKCQLVFIGMPRSVGASHVPSLLPCSPQAQPHLPAISRPLLAAALLKGLPTKCKLVSIVMPCWGAPVVSLLS